MSATLPTLVVDDHRLLAQTLVLALHDVGVDVRAVARTDPHTVLGAVRAAGPCLVLLDLNLGHPGDGQALVAPLRLVGARVLVVTGSASRLELAEAVQAGAIGWVLKADPFENLVLAVLRAARGLPVVSIEDRRRLLDELAGQQARGREQVRALGRLTPREAAVLGELACGRTAQQIARTSGVSVATVRTQIKSILAKLGLDNQMAAAALARRAGYGASDLGA